MLCRGRHVNVRWTEVHSAEASWAFGAVETVELLQHSAPNQHASLHSTKSSVSACSGRTTHRSALAVLAGHHALPALTHPIGQDVSGTLHRHHILTWVVRCSWFVVSCKPEAPQLHSDSRAWWLQASRVAIGLGYSRKMQETATGALRMISSFAFTHDACHFAVMQRLVRSYTLLVSNAMSTSEL